MQIIVAKSAGFCPGVRNAYDTALFYADKDASILGELIHNPLVNKKLEDVGLKVIYSPKDVTTSKVILRCHGEKIKTIEELKKLGVEIIDTTCPFVTKIHNIVEKNYKDGKSIIILGEADHPEVVGINSRCDFTALIINEVSELSSIEIGKHYVLIAQTTFSVSKFEEIIENIVNDYSKIVEIFRTICYTTMERQIEAESLSMNTDASIVIGGKNSSNTMKLFNICAKNSRSVYLIEKITDLKRVVINNIDSLAIIAGASTPPELIEEVTNIMSELVSTNDIEAVLSAEISEPATSVAVEATEKVATSVAVEVTEKVATSVAVEATEKVTKSVKAVAKEPTTMAEAMKLDKNGRNELRSGKRLKGTIISANETGVFVGIGHKKDGFIPKSEATLDGEFNPNDFVKDSKIEVMVIENTSGSKDFILLSKKVVDVLLKQDKEAEDIIRGGEFTIVCDKVAKDEKGNGKGLLGKLGTYTIFVPASHIRTSFVRNLDEYLGKKLRLRALPIKEGEEDKKNNHRIVASQKIVLEKEKTDREEAFWSTMAVGEVVNGKVKRFTDFGAFISVKGFDCLARKADLAWFRIEKPEEILEINGKYDFVVLNVDRENNKVALGYKQLQPTPYELIAGKYEVGAVVHGQVVRISPFGAFISIEPGVDGLVHISQVSYNYIKSLDDVFKIGDEVDAKIIKIDDKKITLSIKELLPEPVAEVRCEQNYMSEAPAPAKPERKPKTTKFDTNTVEEAKAYRDARKEKKEKTKSTNDGEPHEWITDTSAATLGDLFKDMKFNFDDDTDN